MKTQLLVSVVIPTYNGENTVLRAIKSVLDQTYPNVEIIVVDDASEDRTVDVVNTIEDHRIHLIRHSKNKNGATARNTGIKAAKGEYIAFLDDDDEWLPEKITLQLEHLENKDSGIWKAAITSHYILSGNSWGVVILSKEGDITKEILTMEMLLGAGSTLIIHKDVIEKIGYFNEKYLRHQDIEFLLRYLRFYKLGVVKNALVRIYGHGGLPSGEKLEQIKSLLLADFKEDIENLGENTSSRVYARQYLQVARHYAMDGNLKMTLKYLRLSLSHKFLFSKKYIILPFESYFAILFYLLKSKFLNTCKTRE
jgi:glycosyltransferase involved in cell wall biosynthesis